MSVPQESDSFEFADYLGVLRRRWWIVVALACVGVLAGAAYLKVTPKAYIATTTVNVTATGGSQGQNSAVAGGRTTGTINLDTEAQIVQSTTVAAIAVHTLHSSLSPSVLLAKVTVTVPANSSVLQISCTARYAPQAAACANAFGSAYLQNRSASAAGAVNAQLNVVRAQQSTLQKQASQLSTELSTLPTNSAQHGSAQSQLQTVNGELQTLAGQAVSLSAQAASSSGGSIITAATPPTKPSSPKPLLVLPSGLIAGLLIGLIAAFVLDRSGKQVNSVRALDRFGLPALLSLSKKDLGAEPMLSARSAAGIQFTELARVTAATLGGHSHLLLVDGVSAGSGCEMVAANLAAALARTRSGVLLVCPGDESTPEFLGPTEARWLDSATVAELAAGTASLDEVTVQPAGFAGLRVLILGSDLNDLHYEHVKQLALQLRSSAEYVVVEAPASAAGAASFQLAEFCDAALITVEVSRTKLPEIEDSLRLLDRLGIRILGIAAVPRLRLPAGRTQSRDVARHQPGADSHRPEAAVADDAAVAGPADEPAAGSTAIRDEDATLVFSPEVLADVESRVRKI